MDGSTLLLATLVILSLAWFCLDLLRSYDSDSDTAIRGEARAAYDGGRACPRYVPVSDRLRNPRPEDHFRDGAIVMRLLMSDDLSQQQWTKLQQQVVKSFRAALAAMEAGRVCRDLPRSFVVGKIQECRRVLLHGEYVQQLPETVCEDGEQASDPFNVADSQVIDQVGQTVRLLVATYRFEKPEIMTGCLQEAHREAKTPKARWAVETMAKRPSRMPVGEGGSVSDAQVFVCCWKWTQEPRLIPGGVGRGVQASLLACLEETVTDRFEWELGALCRIAQMCQALAGSDDDLVGAVTFQQRRPNP